MTTRYIINNYRASPCKNVDSADIAIGLLIWSKDLKLPDISEVPICLSMLAVAFYTSEPLSPKDRLNPPKIDILLLYLYCEQLYV